MRGKLILSAFIVLASLQLIYANDFPYRLNPYTDGAMLAAGAVGCSSYIWGRNSVEPYTGNDLLSLDKNNVNTIDRSAAGRWSSASDTASTYLLCTISIMPLAYAADAGVRDRWYTLLLMYAESFMLCAGVTETLKVSVHRTRPFVYGSSAPDNEKLSADGRKSFPSGHTSISFNTAVFSSMVFSDLYPSSAWRPAVWAVSLSAVTCVGYLRFRAGKHFPSDIAAGACIGAASAAIAVYSHRVQNG